MNKTVVCHYRADPVHDKNMCTSSSICMWLRVGKEAYMNLRWVHLVDRLLQMIALLRDVKPYCALFPALSSSMTPVTVLPAARLISLEKNRKFTDFTNNIKMLC